MMRITEKGDNSVMDLENLTKVKQVIFTLDTIYDLIIMNLAQAVLDIFCSQPYIEKNGKGRFLSSWILKIL